MTPGKLRAKVVAERAEWVRKMLAGIRTLPLEDFELFQADERNAAAAESYLRRALEAILDLGRHVLAKGFGEPAVEYKEVAGGLARAGVLDEEDAALLRTLAGYRNRLVHFYDEVSQRELYEICRDRLRDVERVLDAVLRWLNANPDRLDQTL